jgi:hypothetical protein
MTKTALTLLALAAFSLPAHADQASNGLARNGFVVNGIQLNGFVVNGLQLNGFVVNGLQLNGFVVNGLRINGVGTDGLSQQDRRETSESFAIESFELPR